MATLDTDQLIALSQPDDARTVVSVDLGRMTFEDGHALQIALQQARRADPERVGHLLLHVEHEPVFTITRRANSAHVVWDEAERERRGVTLADVDRGGDVTFHGPGQLVGYPLLDLRQWKLGTSEYMHRLETTVIRTLADIGISGFTRDDMPGVWVNNDAAAESAKIAAIGVRVSRGLTRHGFSLNHTVDLDWYGGIIPCGLPLPVTSIACEMVPTSPPTRSAMLDRLDAAFAEVLDVQVTRLSI